ncbi:MAG: helix-turn-helix transcriptional regulator [Verrucomicrobia bacterium]|nr:helix-turn-helix transcriptional regulator [Verrucomicrobiota bacterium]
MAWWLLQPLLFYRLDLQIVYSHNVISPKSTPKVAAHLTSRVRARRLQRGWTQAELARRAGLKAATYILFERTGKISLLRLLKVLDVFGVLEEVDRIAREPDLSNVTLDDLAKPTRQRGRRNSS